MSRLKTEQPRRAARGVKMSAEPAKRAKGSALPRSAEILGTVAREIAAGLIAPGTKLEEEALCERFGTSRTPVREALRQLAAQGVLDIRPRLGAFVVQLTVERLIEMFETMGFLEAACAALAARRHTAQDRQVLTDAHQACVRAAAKNNPESFYAANALFHEAIYRACHNQYLERQTLDLRNRVEAYRREVTFHAGLMKLSVAEHAAVLEAILEMDGDRAASHMRRHLDTLGSDAVSMALMVSNRANAG